MRAEIEQLAQDVCSAGEMMDPEVASNHDHRTESNHVLLILREEAAKRGPNPQHAKVVANHVRCRCSGRIAAASQSNLVVHIRRDRHPCGRGVSYAAYFGIAVN